MSSPEITTELQSKFEELQTKYRQHLPNVDPKLISDLLLRLAENPIVAPMYIVEVFLEPGIDSQAVREAIWNETGAVPAIYDNGTHVAAHHRLTLELLKKISEQKGVVEITGEYDTGSRAASHEHVRHDNYERKLQSKTSSSVISFSKKATVAIETESPIKQGISEPSRRKAKKLPNQQIKVLSSSLRCSRHSWSNSSCWICNKRRDATKFK